VFKKLQDIDGSVKKEKYMYLCAFAQSQGLKKATLREEGDLLN